MDLLNYNVDGEGKTICPQCKKHYEPELNKDVANKYPNKCIQTIFPKAKSYQREQLITGICSDECWNKYVEM
jgi:hypothetical protein